MQQIKVGFLSAHNYFDRNAWSGTVYRMYQALKSQNLQMVNLGNPQHPSLWLKVQNRLQGKKQQPPIGSPEYVNTYKNFAAKVEQQIRKNPCDVIFAPVASRELSFLETHIPIIYLSDATPRLIKDTYNMYRNETEFLLSEQQEKSVISKATQIVYPSEWVKNSAVQDYGANGADIHVVPFGANVNPEFVPSPPALFQKCQDQICHLLFIGKDWQRKGGQIAFETLKALNQMGIDADLVMLGCVPPTEVKHEKLKVIPFLNKNIPQEQQEFSQLLLRSHFLLFPTRADCSPIVICEANAFGLPVITTDVGGIPTIIQKGKNGYTLPLSASGQDFADLIAQNFSDSSHYQQLVRDSRQEYETRLNWNQWAKSVYSVITRLCL